MTSLLAKVALAAALTVATIFGLVGISGLIIFADVKAPQPSTVVDQNLSSSSKPLTFVGPTR